MIKHTETIVNTSIRRQDTTWRYEWDIDKATDDDIYLDFDKSKMSSKTWYFEYTDGEPETPGEKTGKTEYTKFEYDENNITDDTKYLNPETNFLTIQNTVENVMIDPIPPSFVSDINTEYIIADGDERYCEYIFQDEAGLDYKNFSIGLSNSRADTDGEFKIDTMFYDYTRKNAQGIMQPTGIADDPDSSVPEERTAGTDHVKNQLGYNKFYINRLKITSDGRNYYKVSFYLTKNVTEEMLNIGKASEDGTAPGKLVMQIWDKAGNFSLYRIHKHFEVITLDEINSLEPLKITYTYPDPTNRVCDEHTIGKVLVTVYNPLKSLWNVPITAELAKRSIGQIDISSYDAGYDPQYGILQFYVNNITQRGDVVVKAYLCINNENPNQKLNNTLYSASVNEVSDGPWIFTDNQNRKYDILSYVPKYLQNTDFYDFMEFFQLYLNSMYTSLDDNRNISVLEKIARINNFDDISNIENTLLNNYSKQFGNEFNVDVQSLKDLNMQIYSTNDYKVIYDETTKKYIYPNDSEYSGINGKDEQDIYDMMKYVMEQLPVYNMYKGTNSGMLMALKMFGFCCKVLNLWCKTDIQIENEPVFIEEDKMKSFMDYFMTSRFNLELSSSNVSYKTLNDNIDIFINIVKSCQPVTRILNKIKYALIFEKNLIFTYRTLDNHNSECLKYSFTWNIGGINYWEIQNMSNPGIFEKCSSMNSTKRFADYFSIDYKPNHIMFETTNSDYTPLYPTNIYSIIAKFLNNNNYRIVLHCKKKNNTVSEIKTNTDYPYYVIPIVIDSSGDYKIQLPISINTPGESDYYSTKFRNFLNKAKYHSSDYVYFKFTEKTLFEFFYDNPEYFSYVTNTIEEDTYDIRAAETKSLVNSGRWYILPESGRSKTMLYTLYNKYINSMLYSSSPTYFNEIKLNLNYYPGTNYIVCSGDDKIEDPNVLEPNTILINIVDSDSARKWVEKNYNKDTFTAEKVSKILYKITNTSNDWTNMFSDSSHSGSSKYLKSVADTGDTSSVTNMNNMFNGCTLLSSVPNFNTKNVTDMSYMLYNCKYIHTIPNFDTNNVSNMSYMLYNCENLTRIQIFDVSNLTNVEKMFYNCKSVESGLLSFYNNANSTSKVIYHSDCFTNCGIDDDTVKLQKYQIPESWGGGIDANTLLIEIVNSAEARTWVETNYKTDTLNYLKKNDTEYYITNTSSDWSHMFSNATHKGSSSYLLKVLDTGDTSSVTNMSYIFGNCQNLTSVSLFDTSNVEDMSYMFYKCKNLISVPAFNTNKVINMNAMFDGCKALTSVPLFDTSNIIDMSYMFNDCTSLTSIPLFNTSEVEYMTSMFQNCTKVESGAFALFEQASSTEKVSEHEDCFKNCGSNTESGLAELKQIPVSWGGIKEE